MVPAPELLKRLPFRCVSPGGAVARVTVDADCEAVPLGYDSRIPELSQLGAHHGLGCRGCDFLLFFFGRAGWGGVVVAGWGAGRKTAALAQVYPESHCWPHRP